MRWETHGQPMCHSPFVQNVDTQADGVSSTQWSSPTEAKHWANMRLRSEILDSCLGSNQFRYIHLLPFPYQTPSSLQLASYHNTYLHCLTHNTSFWTAYKVLYQTEAVTLSFTYTRTGSSSMPSSLSTIQIFIKQSIQIQIWPQV